MVVPWMRVCMGTFLTGMRNALPSQYAGWRVVVPGMAAQNDSLKAMRIGYFGGTFDPPHRAHLAVAVAAARAFHLDRVLFAPTGRQPLKTEEAIAPYADRLAMVRLLCAAASGAGVPVGAPFVAAVPAGEMEASDLDAPHADGSQNYTVDALEALRAASPGAALFCIVGADSMLSLPRWKEPQRLLELAEWIVVSRPEVEFDLPSLGFTVEQQRRIHLLTDVEDDTSSTGVRERLRYGVSTGDRLTPEVMLYIARMRLYHPER